MKTPSILLFLATALAQPADRPFTQQTLQDFLENSAPFDFVLIDVRSAPEVTAGIGSNSCRPYNLAWPTQFQQEIGRIPKDLAIIVYCAGGNRSRQAAAYLREAGYTNVYDAGGFLTWDGQPFPIRHQARISAARTCLRHKERPFRQLISGPSLQNCRPSSKSCYPQGGGRRTQTATATGTKDDRLE